MYIDNMIKWKNHAFSSGTVNGKDFLSFARALKFCLNKNVKEITDANGKQVYSLESFNVGHYYVSGFIKNNHTNKLVYFSVSDVRGGRWYSDILVRTANHLKDFTGGPNNFTKLDFFFNSVGNLSS